MKKTIRSLYPTRNGIFAELRKRSAITTYNDSGGTQFWVPPDHYSGSRYQSGHTLISRLPVILKNSSRDSTLVSVRMVE